MQTKYIQNTISNKAKNSFKQEPKKCITCQIYLIKIIIPHLFKGCKIFDK